MDIAVNKIEIPNDLHDSELLCFLHPNRFQTEDEKLAIGLLHKICMANLTDFRDSNQIKDLILTAEEREIVLLHDWNISENIEVRSRCNDVLCRFEKDKRSIKEIASNNYLTAYKTFGEIEFLIRSITVRNIKIINTEDFLIEVVSVINEKFDSPFWIQKVVDSLKKSYSKEDLKKLCDYVKSEQKKSRDRGHYNEEREYIKAQYSLNVVSKQEFHKYMALSFENEADITSNNKQPHTFYPNLVDVYQNAYNEIYQIKTQEPKIFERLKEKLLQEKRIFMEMLSFCGIKYKIEIPEDFVNSVEESLSTIIIHSFFDTIKLMLSVPFISTNEINAYESAVRKASYVSSMLGRNQLDTNGNIVGIADHQKSLRTEAHIYFRQKRLYAIQTYLNLHQWSNIKSEEELIYYFLNDKKPICIEDENLIFWAKGITMGLNKDFISASHILMPQLEHTLHNIAEIKNGNITTLERKRQESPSLGAIFPMLQNIIKEEALFEIESFLQSGIDVNFRNNLLHGLLTPFEIEKYGVYLWWICLRIYFDGNSLLE